MRNEVTAQHKPAEHGRGEVGLNALLDDLILAAYNLEAAAASLCPGDSLVPHEAALTKARNAIIAALSLPRQSEADVPVVGQVIEADDGRKFKFLGYGNYDELPSKTAFVHGPATTPPAAQGFARTTPEQEAADWANNDKGSIMEPDNTTPAAPVVGFHGMKVTVNPALPPDGMVVVPRVELEAWYSAFSEEAAAYYPDTIHHIEVSAAQIKSHLQAAAAPGGSTNEELK